ncbi:hypothetical protein C5E51_28090 [Nocardia nova]|uniref:hypothetical protein n=1 Tax=Nocardia nova TaxID=37330 RepID=UPI000CEA47F4|nr:hypothetical protein [Nocardia nova]PPJ03334.1 hypothetical protein C5E51_28090 [Nocardia nova]
MFETDIYQEHLDAVAIVRAQGGTVSKKWTEIDSRYEAFQYRQSSPIDDLYDAIVSGADEATLNRKYSDVVADTVASVDGTAKYVSGTAESVIKGEVRRRIAVALIKEYATTAEANIQTIADQFDTAYARFLELASAIDPETPPERLVGQPMEVQTAWLESAEVSARLETLLRALKAAVGLAGVHNLNNDAEVSLVAPTDAVGMHKRAVWDAWNTDGRCGRWSALAAADIEVRAIRSAGEFKRLAKPQITFVTEATPTGGMRQWAADAESGEKLHQVGF